MLHTLDVLLYAQPLSRVARLTINDVIRDHDQVLLRLGEPPSPVPTPFAQLPLTWITERGNMNTATNPDSQVDDGGFVRVGTLSLLTSAVRLSGCIGCFAR
ncbi:MAG: hypothetical protein ACRDRU_23055 [Pseudonocardiaceae bacterium]